MVLTREVNGSKHSPQELVYCYLTTKFFRNKVLYSGDLDFETWGKHLCHLIQK